MKKLISTIIVLTLLTACTQASTPQTYDSDQALHLVKRAIDGDTIELEDSTRVRLLGINSPEEGECYYKESKNFLT